MEKLRVFHDITSVPSYDSLLVHKFKIKSLPELDTEINALQNCEHLVLKDASVLFESYVDLKW